MKLTPEQIDQLYAFTRQHYVEYYDLQTELVDHLANAIEQQWQDNPKISFEDALQMEFKKFEVMGFTDLVEKRKFALQQKYEKIAWGHLKEFFKFPLILLILTIFLGLEFYLEKEVKFLVTSILSGVFLGLKTYHWIVRIIRKYKRGKINHKKWLFEEVLREHQPLTFFGFLFFTSYYMPNLKEKLHFHISYFVQSLIDSAFIAYLGLYIYIMLILIPSKVKQYLKETYPEYEISK